MKTYLSKLAVLALLLIAAAAPSFTHGGDAFFLNVPNVPGESTQKGHEGQIDVLSFNLGVTQTGLTDYGGGAVAGKSRFLPVKVYKSVDKSSPLLFLACATGKVFPTVTLTASHIITNPSGAVTQDYLVVTLANVVVSALNEDSADSGGSATVLETVSLNFSKIQISYQPQNSDGGLGTAITAGFDGKLNKSFVPPATAPSN